MSSGGTQGQEHGKDLDQLLKAMAATGESEQRNEWLDRRWSNLSNSGLARREGRKLKTGVCGVQAKAMLAWTPVAMEVLGRGGSWR